jgi:hypothetical protein
VTGTGGAKYAHAVVQTWKRSSSLTQVRLRRFTGAISGHDLLSKCAVERELCPRRWWRQEDGAAHKARLVQGRSRVQR